MIIPNSMEELEVLSSKMARRSSFVADWCSDCRYIYPSLARD